MSDYKKQFEQFSKLNGPKVLPVNMSSNFYETLYQAFKDRLLDEFADNKSVKQLKFENEMLRERLRRTGLRDSENGPELTDKEK